MTDEQIVRTIADRVMGWKVHARNTAHWTDAGKWNDCDYVWRASVNDWSPLTSISDAFMVIEKLQDMGWTVTLALRQFESQPRDRNVFHGCRMVGSPQKMESFCDRAETPCRAICLAAISAISQELKPNP